MPVDITRINLGPQWANLGPCLGPHAEALVADYLWCRWTLTWQKEPKKDIVTVMVIDYHHGWMDDLG